MPHGLETRERRLLRLLFIRHGAMPSNSGERQSQRMLRVGLSAEANLSTDVRSDRLLVDPIHEFFAAFLTLAVAIDKQG
jgi:hypothetical protein